VAKNGFAGNRSGAHVMCVSTGKRRETRFPACLLSDVEMGDVQGVLLDELLAGFHDIAHERREDFLGIALV